MPARLDEMDPTSRPRRAVLPVAPAPTESVRKLRGLLAKFLAVLSPIFIALSALGLGLLHQYDMRTTVEAVAARVGNAVARTGGAITRHHAGADADLAHDLIAQLGADHAILCAELRSPSGALTASLPAVIGCKGQSSPHRVAVTVGDDDESTFTVLFSDAELVEAAALKRNISLSVLAFAFVVALVSATLGFRFIIGVPLGRLHAAIAYTAVTGTRATVGRHGDDAIGDVAAAYDELVLAEERRERELVASNDALAASREELRRINDELESRIDQRTAELVEQTRRAEEASLAKSEFLATMSHEIRTPLNGVLGTLELVLDSPLDDEQKRLVRLSHASGEALLDILSQVLDFSSIESGRLRIGRTEFPLAPLVEDVVSLLGAGARKKNLALRLVHALPADARFIGDPVRLRQVLVNLIGNAIKFTERGEVVVEVIGRPGTPAPGRQGADEPASFEFRVSDTGVGISPATRAKIFEPFAQADGTMARRFGGIGLGLAICRKVVEAMGGQIGLDDPREGAVFWFTVTLDRAASPVTETTGPRPVQPALAKLPGRSVLLVEDNPVNRQVAAKMLKSLGCVFEVAEDGFQAVDQFVTNRFELVLMDCQLPGIDGYEATRRIRAIERVRGGARTPIVAVTANAMPGDRERCIESGMDDYIAKPLRRAELTAMMEKWLADREATTVAA